MTEIEKDWKERTSQVATKWECHRREEAMSVSWFVLSEFKESLRKALREKENELSEDEMDEWEAGVVTGYRNAFKLIDEVLPPRS